MKVDKREKGKIYAYRTKESVGYAAVINIYVGKTRGRVKWFCYDMFSEYTGIELKPGQMIEIEIKSKGVVGETP